MDYTQIGVAAHAFAAVVFWILTIWMSIGWRIRGSAGKLGVALVGVMAISCLWASAAGAALLTSLIPAWVVSALDIARSGAWVVFVMLAVSLLRSDQERPLWRRQATLIALAFLVLGVGELAFDLDGLLGVEGSIDFFRFAQLGLTLIGIVLVENLFQLSRRDNAWLFKHLVLALAMLFAFELAFHVQELLLRTQDPAMSTSRAFIALFVMPLILISTHRIRDMSFNIAISRNAAFHTTTLVLAGLYLISVSAMGFIIRETGWLIGPLLQILLLFGAVMVLAVVLISGRVRAMLKLQIARHFFQLNYDWRHEWLRFIRRMSLGENTDLSLHARSVRVLADIFECARGALYVRRKGGIYPISARWNLSQAAEMAGLPPNLAQAVDDADVVIDLRERGAAVEADPEADPLLASWYERMNTPWLLVPLRSRDEVVGAIVLSEARVPRDLTWEDRDLLQILGYQLGSYVAEDQALRQLYEAQRFEQISKNFSFVAHDLKNLVSQLSLIVQNANRHGSNPEFVRDALETVENSVEKMRAMLVRLKEVREGGGDDTPEVDIGAILRRFTERLHRLVPDLTVILPQQQMPVRVDALGLESILDNLLQNAVEATGREGKFEVGAEADGGQVAIWVTDNGPGMTRAFIEKRLFQPFSGSSKGGGFGIGLYQTREFVERFGGTCDIDSEVGRGTTVRLTLPLAGSVGDRRSAQPESDALPPPLSQSAE